MKFEIPFNKKIYEDQMKLKFGLVWKRGLLSARKNLIFGVITLAFGILILYGENNLGLLFIILGSLNILLAYNYYSTYRKNKKKYFDTVDSESKIMENLKDVAIWEFNEEFFRFKFYKFDAKFNWVAFNGFRIIDDNIFLDLTDQDDSYVFGKNEINEDNYNQLLTFLKSKFDKNSVQQRV